MGLHSIAMEDSIEVNEDKKTPWWTDDKFQELLVNEKFDKEESFGGLIIGDMLISKKQLTRLINVSKKVYGGLYANGKPRYAEKYPEESQIQFMKRWGAIIANLEKIQVSLKQNKEETIVVRL